MDNTDIKKTINSLPSTEISNNYTVCPQCGRKVSAEFAYCNFCGCSLADEYTAHESEKNDQALYLEPEYEEYKEYKDSFDNISYTHETYNTFSDLPHETTDEDVSDCENELSENAYYTTKTDESEDYDKNCGDSLSSNLFICIFITFLILPLIIFIVNLILKNIGG